MAAVSTKEGGEVETKSAVVEEDVAKTEWDSLHEASMRRAMRRETEMDARDLGEDDVIFKFCRVNDRLLARMSAKFPDDSTTKGASQWFREHCVVVTPDMSRSDKDFKGVEPDDEDMASTKRKALRLYMHKWYKAMRPFYTRIMGEDDGVWAEIDDDTNKMDGLGCIRLHTKWEHLSEKEHDLIFRAAHSMLMQCRILLGEDAPEKSALERLMEEFKGVSDLDGDTIRTMHKRLFSEIMQGDADIGAAIDNIMDNMGGIDEVFKKMSDPDQNPLRRKTKKAKKQRRTMRRLMRDSLENVMDMMLGESSEEEDDDDEEEDDEGSESEGSESGSDGEEESEEEEEEEVPEPAPKTKTKGKGKAAKTKGKERRD